MSSQIRELYNILSKGKLASGFARIIKEADIYGEKPLGSLRDFQAAFRSSKTDPLVRYLMGLSAFMGDNNLIDRRLKGLGSIAKYRFSAQYVKKGRRIKLSHFKIRVITPSGSSDFKMSKTTKKMMMGTPVDARGAGLTVAALSTRKKRGKDKKKRKTPERKPRTKKIAEKPTIDRKLLTRRLALLQHRLRAAEVRLIKQQQHREALIRRLDALKKGNKEYAKSEAGRNLRLTSPVYKKALFYENKFKDKMGLSPDQIAQEKGMNFAYVPHLGNANVREGYMDEQNVGFTTALDLHHNTNDISEYKDPEDPILVEYDKFKTNSFSKGGKVFDTFYKRYAPSTRKKLARTYKQTKGVSRPLTPNEKARILQQIFELSKHYMQLIWVISSTIKLNDRRRRFGYIDDDYVYKFKEGEETINLYNFPEHLQHYINEHMKFKAEKGFEGFGIHPKEEALYTAMTRALNFASEIDGKSYDTPEEAQDEIEKLIPMLFPILHYARHQHAAIMESKNVFNRTVTPYDEPPKKLLRHIRHNTLSPKEFVRIGGDTFESLPNKRATDDSIQRKIDNFAQRFSQHQPKGLRPLRGRYGPKEGVARMKKVKLEPKKRGRPKKPVPKRPPGRPKGSKNKKPTKALSETQGE